ncbi:MAG: multicopper polyphenol oxidase [Proteobacteria bacterium]|nr:MAG: multicopper polyphenol oxidase [Pseudomonadota bacterium]PIE67422.1 MAG: multicopper polyphenol oxidase [Deltaproteobacteria bacterium]
MYLIKKHDKYFFRFAALDRLPGVVHAFSSRLGGTSRTPYESLNLSSGAGDMATAVHANRDRFYGLTGGRHVYARQCHGTAVGVVDRQVLDDESPIRTHEPAVDALITNVPGVFLVIQTADCQAVMVVDPWRKVVANIHCGWRGSVAGIIGATIARMVDDFGCRPSGMTAVIGPSLGPCCAEFVNYHQEIPRKWWPFRIGRHHFDFWAINRQQLVSAGLTSGRIFFGNLCTRCNTHLLYSYRSERVTGRMGALIGIQRSNHMG